MSAIANTKSSRAEWRVPVGGEETSAVFEPANTEEQGIVFVCAHGAGGNMNDRGMLAVANALRSRGIGVVRFNFLYKEKGSGRPDPMPRLKECVTAVVARAREELQPGTLIIGGRSMGGRAASMLAAEGWKMHWLEGADHGFHVLKSSGRTDAEVLVEIANAAEAWAARLKR